MIIEYAGLPGSGKTTLQQALTEALEQFEIFPTQRYDLQQEVIQQSIPLDRSTALRRVSSALYKARLSALAMTNPGTRLRVREFMRPHLVRAAHRCVETQLLYRYVNQKNEQRWYDIDEGITQNFCSLRVWRSLLKPKQTPVSYDWLADYYHRQRQYLVRLSLPVTVALERLNLRGRPSLWPTAVPLAEILDAYKEEMIVLDRLLQQQDRVVSLVRVDANLPIAEWPRVARQLSQEISSIAP